MIDKRISKAFDKLHEAWTLLEKVRNDESVDFDTRHICANASKFVRQDGQMLVNLVATETDIYSLEKEE